MKNLTQYLLCTLAVTLPVASQAYEPVQLGDFTLTPYARLVAGVEAVDNYYQSGLSSSKVETSANNWGTSYLGSSASIPFAAGWVGQANLEMGFDTEDGSSNDESSLFNRQANVGVRSEQFGTLSAGTHLVIAQDIIDMDPMGFQSYGLNTLTNGVNDGTADNSVLYRSPELYGASLGYMHMFGGEVGNPRKASGDGASVNYRLGDFQLRGVYLQRADDYGRYIGGETYGLGSQGQWLYVKNYAVGASYQLADVKMMAGYDQAKAPDAGFGQSYTFDDQAQVVWGGVNYKLNDKLTLLAAYYQLDQDYSAKKGQLYVGGVNYELNRYLTLYTTVGYINNNSIDSSLSAETGTSSHALSYNQLACSDTSNCDGSSQLGTYAGLVVKL